MLSCPNCKTDNQPDSIFCRICRFYLRPVGSKYRLLKELGSGGFGTVYRGINSHTGYPVAIKVMHTHLTTRNRGQLEARFRREAQILQTNQHPHIVRMFEYGNVEELGIYLVMEWLEGKTLELVIEEQPHKRFLPEETLPLFAQFLDGLKFIHEQGIVHRDIKPPNLMIVQERGMKVVKILDFGIAKIDASQHLTGSRAVMGTPHFMAPEQIQGHRDKVGPAADLYSAGILLAWMLTGKCMFDGDGVQEIFHQHCFVQPPSLKKLCPEGTFSQEMEDVVKRAVEKDPEDRFRSTEEFVAALAGAVAPSSSMFMGATPSREIEIGMVFDPSGADESPKEGPAREKTTGPNAYETTMGSDAQEVMQGSATGSLDDVEEPIKFLEPTLPPARPSKKMQTASHQGSIQTGVFEEKAPSTSRRNMLFGLAAVVVVVLLVIGVDALRKNPAGDLSDAGHKARSAVPAVRVRPKPPVRVTQERIAVPDAGAKRVAPKRPVARPAKRRATGRRRPPPVRDPKAFYSARGIRAFMAGQYAMAAKAYRKVIAHDPRYAPAHFRLGLALREQLGCKNPRRAQCRALVKHFRAYLRLSPRRPRPRFYKQCNEAIRTLAMVSLSLRSRRKGVQVFHKSSKAAKAVFLGKTPIVRWFGWNKRVNLIFKKTGSQTCRLVWRAKKATRLKVSMSPDIGAPLPPKCRSSRR